ncbi:hypothetical protein P2318_32000 [Myxococcaceae bacterium GXIMD 01537]
MRRPRIPWRALGKLAALGVLALVLGWQNYRLRHYLLRVVTFAETALAKGPGPLGTGAVPEAGTPPTYIHAARGKPGVGPNSAAAVAHTVEHFRRVEVDVGFSRDLVPYLSHGDDLAERSGKPLGLIEDLDSRELDALVLLDGSRLVRLEDFLAREAPRFDALTLDLKALHWKAEEKAAVLTRLLAGVPREKVLLLSLCGTLLFWLKASDPNLKVGSESFGVVANGLAGFDIYSTHYTAVHPFWDGVARRLGLLRFYWTAYDAQELSALMSLKPDALILDLSLERAPPVAPEWRRLDAPAAHTP